MRVTPVILIFIGLIRNTTPAFLIREEAGKNIGFFRNTKNVDYNKKRSNSNDDDY